MTVEEDRRAILNEVDHIATLATLGREPGEDMLVATRRAAEQLGWEVTDVRFAEDGESIVIHRAIRMIEVTVTVK